MQRDIDLTFEDILGSPDLHDSDIYKYGVAAVKRSDSTNTSTNLRFLHIPELGPDFRTSDVTYTITDSGQYRGMVDYVAVSYCWNSFGQINTPSSDPPTKVSVIDQGVTRSPRCPADVLFRAVNFALARGVSLIWIDQECINQTDDADVQNHLQCMHDIFKQAKFAIGLLNFELTNWGQYRALMRCHFPINLVEQNLNEADSPPEFLQSVQSIKFTTRLLKSVRRDRWFSRTWVFQERFSAQPNMHLLFRVSSEVRSCLQASNDTGPFWGDVAFSVKDIGSIPALWSLVLKQTSTETTELHLALEALHVATWSICILFEGVNIELLISALVTGRKLHARNHPADGFLLNNIFHHIESCDNQVVSDRVAIFANVAELDWRIETIGLASYSLSLLVILHLNHYVPCVLIRQADEIDFSSPFVLDVQKLSLIERSLQLRVLKESWHEGLDEDLQAINSALTEVLPVHLWQYETTEAFIADYREGGPNYSLLPLLDSPAGNLKRATIIPMSATIEGLFGGVIKDTSVKRADLSHSYGSRIVRYAVEHGQLPEGSTFLAFFGAYCWRPEFIDEHFLENSL